MRIISRKGKIKKKKIQVKDNIKQATLDLLAEKGCASVSTRDIAKRADVALGQITYYYKTKDSLILEVIDETIENFILELEKIANESSNKIEDLRKYFDNIINEEYKIARIIIDLISQSLYSKALNSKAKNMIDKISNIFVKVIMKEDNKLEEEAKQDSENYINYFLGATIRKNINKEAKDIEKYAFNSYKGNKIKQKGLSAKLA